MKQRWEHIQVKESPIHGMGVFAGKDFKKGELVGEYTGEIITEEEADKRYPDPSWTLLFSLDDDKVLDGGVGENPLKHMNHSKKLENCESQQDDDKIFIYTTKKIKKGQELLYDYQLIVDNPEDYHLVD